MQEIINRAQKQNVATTGTYTNRDVTSHARSCLPEGYVPDRPGVLGNGTQG